MDGFKVWSVTLSRSCLVRVQFQFLSMVLGLPNPRLLSCSPAMKSVRVVARLTEDDGHGDAQEEEGLGLGLGRGQGALGNAGRRDQRRTQALTPRNLQTAARYIRDLGGGTRRDPRGSLIVLVCLVGKRLARWPAGLLFNPQSQSPRPSLASSVPRACRRRSSPHSWASNVKSPRSPTAGVSQSVRLPLVALPGSHRAIFESPPILAPFGRSRGARDDVPAWNGAWHWGANGGSEAQNGWATQTGTGGGVQMGKHPSMATIQEHTPPP